MVTQALLKFLQQLINLGDTVEVVLDARHINSSTERYESRLIEPLVPQLVRSDKIFKSAIDFVYAYAHAPSDEETTRLTTSSVRGI